MLLDIYCYPIYYKQVNQQVLSHHKFNRAANRFLRKYAHETGGGQQPIEIVSVRHKQPSTPLWESVEEERAR